MLLTLNDEYSNDGSLPNNASEKNFLLAKNFPLTMFDIVLVEFFFCQKKGNIVINTFGNSITI